MEQGFKGFYNGKEVLITGADGFIGSYLTESLVNYGAKVSIFVKNEKLKNLNGIKDKLKEIIIGKIEDKKTIKQIIENKPQIIFHLAANSSVENSVNNPLEINKINLNGTLNILESAKLLRNLSLERLIFSSSSTVYGTKTDPIKETDTISPSNPYGASKAAAEFYCCSYFKTYNIPITIIRPFNIYGPRQRENVISLFISAALKDKNISLEGTGLQTRDFIYVDDIVNGFLTIGSNKKAIGGVFNFGSGNDINMKDLASKIIKFSNSNSKIIFAPERLGQDLKSCCDYSKVKSLFDWKPRISIDEGLKRTIEWEKSKNDTPRPKGRGIHSMKTKLKV